MYTYLLVAGRLARLVHGANDLDDGQQNESGNDAAHRVQADLGQLEEGGTAERFVRCVVDDGGCNAQSKRIQLCLI